MIIDRRWSLSWDIWVSPCPIFTKCSQWALELEATSRWHSMFFVFNVLHWYVNDFLTTLERNMFHRNKYCVLDRFFHCHSYLRYAVGSLICSLAYGTRWIVSLTWYFFSVRTERMKSCDVNQSYLGYIWDIWTLETRSWLWFIFAWNLDQYLLCLCKWGSGRKTTFSCARLLTQGRNSSPSCPSWMIQSWQQKLWRRAKSFDAMGFIVQWTSPIWSEMRIFWNAGRIWDLCIARGKNGGTHQSCWFRTGAKLLGTALCQSLLQVPYSFIGRSQFMSIVKVAKKSSVNWHELPKKFLTGLQFDDWHQCTNHFCQMIGRKDGLKVLNLPNTGRNRWIYG